MKQFFALLSVFVLALTTPAAAQPRQSVLPILCAPADFALREFDNWGVKPTRARLDEDQDIWTEWEGPAKRWMLTLTYAAKSEVCILVQTGNWDDKGKGA